jgi:hypothetical protein
MRQHVERTIELTQRWADALYRSEDSRCELDDALKDYENLRTEFNELVRLWNRYIEMVGPQPVGRPLQAGDAQIAEVRKLRNAGASLRKIATETNLGLRTVRTITGQQDRSDRTSQKREELRHRSLTRNRMLDWRRRRRAREAMPGQLVEIEREAMELLKR